MLPVDANPATSPAVGLDFPHTGNIISSPRMAVPYCLLNSSGEVNTEEKDVYRDLVPVGQEIRKKGIKNHS